MQMRHDTCRIACGVCVGTRAHRSRPHTHPARMSAASRSREPRSCVVGGVVMHDRTSASRPSRRPQRPCKCGTTHAAPRVACVGSRAHRSRRRTPRPHEHERRPSDRHLWARTAVATPCALSPLPVPHACTRSDDQRSSALQLARGRPCASDTAVVRPPRPARGAPRPLAEAAPGSPAQPPLPPTQWRRGQILHQTDGSAGVGGAAQRISEGHVKTLLGFYGWRSLVG